MANGILWGRGDISIESLHGPGEEDGIGGVVVLSVQHQQRCQQNTCVHPTPTTECTEEVG